MAGTTYTSFDVDPTSSASPTPASLLREDYAGWPYRGGTDPDAFGFGTVHGYGGGPVGIATGTTADRKGGRDLPIFWSEVDLRAFRVIARQLDSTNFFGIGFMNLLVAYGVRKGYGWQACKVGAEKTAYATTAGKQEPVVEKAQAILDQFRSQEKWPLKSREAWRRWRRDGEVFGRFFYGGYGRLPRHRFVEPEQIGSPTGSTDDDDSFGIRNMPGDVTIPEEYFVREMGTADVRRGGWVEASRIVHIKANVDSTIKRGVTDFLPVTATLADVARLLRNLTGTSIEQTKYAWWERFPTATVGQVQGLLGQIGSDQRRPNISGPNVPYWYDNANTNSMTSLPPGSVLRTEGSREIDATPGPANAEAHIAILQAGLRGCCVRWGAPEYASGDASNNNMASATVAGGLFPTVMEGEQMAFGTQWERESALRVLDLATEAGLLSRAERSQLDVEVTEPAVVTPEPDKDATRVIGLVNARLLSPQTAQLQLQLDPQHEAENWTAWDAANPPLVQPGAGVGDPDATPRAPAGVAREHLTTPPYPGAVFNTTSHRWEVPDRDQPRPTADGTVAALAADLPAEARDPTLWAKVKAVAEKVHGAVYAAVLRATPTIMAVLPELIDTPDDFKKFGFAPSVSGTAGSSGDPIKAATGISTHLACSIASRVLAKAYVWAKHRAAAESAADAVEWVAALVEALNKACGIDAPADRAAIRAALEPLLARAA